MLVQDHRSAQSRFWLIISKCIISVMEFLFFLLFISVHFRTLYCLTLTTRVFFINKFKYFYLSTALNTFTTLDHFIEVFSPFHSSSFVSFFLPLQSVLHKVLKVNASQEPLPLPPHAHPRN